MATKQKNRQKQNAKKAQKQKKRQEKIKAQQKQFRKTIQPSAEDAVDYALQLLDDGESNECKIILNELRKKHRKHSHVHFGLGVLAASEEKHEEAAVFFEKATQITPDFIEAFYNLAATYQQQFKLKEMIEAYQQIIKKGEQEDPLVDKAKEAIEYFEELIRETEDLELDEYLEANMNFDKGVKLMGTQNWEEAITRINNSIEINPNAPQALGNLGICYSNLGKNKLAIEFLDEAIELDPMYELALVNREIIEALDEGECLNSHNIKTVDYYKDYSIRENSISKR